MKKYIITTLVLAAATSPALSQSRKDSLSTKVVDVVKSYAPTIADAYKKRDDAKIKDSITVQKKIVSYPINSVPVASTFVPEKGKAALVKPKIIRDDYFDSYIGAAFGMINTLVGEANVTYPVNDNSKFSLLADHFSSNGDISGAIPDTNYAISNGQLNYDYQNNELAWGLEGYLGRRMHNWYGIRPSVFTDTSLYTQMGDTQQVYLDYGVGGYLQCGNPYFKGFDFRVNALSDHYDSKEINFKAVPTFELPLSNDQLIRASALLDYYEGSFTRQNNLLNELNNRWMLIALKPSYVLDIDKLSVKLGVSLFYADANQSDQDKFHPYPDVEASYAISPNTIAIAGVRGSLQQNTLANLSKENPFIAPMQEIKPTNVQADAFLGLNGKINSNLQYRVQGSYRQSKEHPLFTTLTEEPLFGANKLPYQYYNSFKVIYDELADYEFLGSIDGKIKDIVYLNLEGKYNYYQARTQLDKTAWNLPKVRLSLTSDFKILPNLFAGLDVYYIGDRYDLDYTFPPFLTPAKINLSGYIDVNLHADYTFSKHWQVYAKANNLSTQKHKLWAFYPSQSIQIYAGIRYLFSIKK